MQTRASSRRAALPSTSQVTATAHSPSSNPSAESSTGSPLEDSVSESSDAEFTNLEKKFAAWQKNFDTPVWVGFAEGFKTLCSVTASDGWTAPTILAYNRMVDHMNLRIPLTIKFYENFAERAVTVKAIKEIEAAGKVLTEVDQITSTLDWEDKDSCLEEIGSRARAFTEMAEAWQKRLVEDDKTREEGSYAVASTLLDTKLDRKGKVVPVERPFHHPKGNVKKPESDYEPDSKYWTQRYLTGEKKKAAKK